MAPNSSQSEFTVSNTSPNISTASSGYSTAEDSGLHDDSSLKSTKIKKEDVELSEVKLSSPKVAIKSETTTKDLSLSIASLIKPTTPVHSNQHQQGSIIWNHMAPQTDNIYEMATRILFASVKWARTQRSFLGLPFPDQVLLLEDAWSDLFIITATETKFLSNESKYFCSSFSFSK